MRSIVTGLLMGVVIFAGATHAWADDAKLPDGQKDACGEPCKQPVRCECPDYPCCECRKAQPAKCPPKYENLRFKENWRPCLCIPCCERDGFWDRIKAKPLTRNNGVWVNVGGQARFRFESFNNIGFGAPADPHDAWLLGRFRLHADVHFGNHFRVFAEGIYADQWEERELGARPIDRNRGDLLNLFAEVHGEGAMGKGGAWAGRRELQTGKQRLVSPLDWANTRRTFQGLGGWWSRGHHSVDAWVTNPVTIRHDDWDEGDDDSVFWGVDYTNRTMTCYSWGGYVYGLDRDLTSETRYTVGARGDGKIPNTRFDWDVEGAYQFGELGAADVSAYMVSASFGWKPCTPCGDPRIGVGFDYASGDSNPGNGTVGTFNQLFPLGHKYLGHADLIGRQNVMAARIEGSYKIFPKLTLSAWFHAFWRAETDDAAYNAAGGVLRAAGGSGASEIGTELDVMLAYKIDRHWKCFVEWAHFFPGSFIEETGPSREVDIWYLGIQGTF